MTRRLAVLLGGIRAGTLTQGTRTEFTYDQKYLDLETPTPLSLSMPVRGTDRWRQAQVLPWLDGLLPDSSEVRARWGARFAASPTNPFALLSHMGRDCPGAVQICAEFEVNDVSQDAGELLELAEADLAARLTALTTDVSSWTVPGERWSLGGAQAKFALAHHDGRWFEATGAAATTHIVKPGIAGFAGQAFNEHLCMSAARELGIPAAATTYTEFDSRPAIVVERYDRTTVGGVVRRVHQEDLCQALSAPPRLKYESDGGPGSALIADLLHAQADEQSLWRFVEAVAFNYLIGASDAHAKNYSVLLSGTQVRLAPLYDVASSLPYDPVEEPSDLRRTAMAIAGERNFGKVNSRRLHKFAIRCGVDPDRLHQRVVQLSEQIPDAMAKAARQLPVTTGPARLADRLAAHLAAARKNLALASDED